MVDHMICTQAAVSREKLSEPEGMMQVEFVFPHASIKTSVKREDSINSLLSAVEDQDFWDSYYTSETRILDGDTRIADLNLSSGSRIYVHPRLTGGNNGAGSSSSYSGDAPVTRSITLASVCSVTLNISLNISLNRYVGNLKRDLDWFEIVDVPESLRKAHKDPFVVMLGKDGRETLLLILECLERVHGRGKCFQGRFDEKDIFFNVERGVFEISVDHMADIDHDGFKLDLQKIAGTVNNHFQYKDKRFGRCHPMYINEFIKEISLSSLDPEYFSNIKKRSLIFNNLATMSSPRRVHIYTALVRHWKELQGVNKTNFEKALDPVVTADQQKVEKLDWINQIPDEATVLTGRLTYNHKSYRPTRLSRLDYSRCVFEHGPSDKVADCDQVTEKQCEASLYMLWPDQLIEVQKKLIIDYAETSTSAAGVPQPSSARSGSSLVPGVRVVNTLDVVQLFSKN